MKELILVKACQVDVTVSGAVRIRYPSHFRLSTFPRWQTENFVALFSSPLLSLRGTELFHSFDRIRSAPIG